MDSILSSSIAETGMCSSPKNGQRQRFKGIHLTESNPKTQNADKLIETTGSFFAVMRMPLSSPRTTHFSKPRHSGDEVLKKQLPMCGSELENFLERFVQLAVMPGDCLTKECKILVEDTRGWWRRGSRKTPQMRGAGRPDLKYCHNHTAAVGLETGQATSVSLFAHFLSRNNNIDFLKLLTHPN